ncbi:unnamed protein product [Caenorhabditis auriculariae]|uniref:Hypoxia up-regulated protein 1 n=1 Tax=Caenorhabditis auriculariae TaxID=2777116 RepID=A0A8S1HJD2_9PELO|nr:unnamed protein product [Caenorhabditis auriculariae]
MRLSLVLTLLSAVLLGIFVQKTHAALAAMSIDLGSQFIKIGIVKPGVPMDIVLNKESRRKTPNVIAFKGDERFFAEAAAAMASSHPKSAYSFLLSLIAKKDGDPFIPKNCRFFPYSETKYNVETLLAMILWSAKQTTEAHAGQSVKDVVITVPIFLNQAERRAIATAADIAGLNLLQLLNDGSAAALNYGVFRRKEITETPQTMLIYDMGALKTTATIVEYVLESTRKDGKDKQPAVKTIGVGFDKTLGGLEITTRLRGHLEKVFRNTVKTTTDINTNARSMGKLHKEAERVKQVLSANKDTYAQVEGLHEEHNFRAKVTREELEGLITDLEPRVAVPIKDALKMANKQISEIDLIVLMGAGTRVPKVKEILKEFVGDKELGNFLNTDEAIALGAVYQAAHLSKSFKVLPLTVHELVISPIQVNFLTKTEDGTLKPAARTLFAEGTYYPTSNKIINFNSYDDDFEVRVSYGSRDGAGVTGNSGDISLIEVRGVKAAKEKELIDENSEYKGVRTSFAIDNSGIVSVAKSTVVVERKPSAEELSTYETLKNEFDEWEKEQEEIKKKEKEEKKNKKEKKEDKVKEETDGENKEENLGAENKTEEEKPGKNETEKEEKQTKKEKRTKPVEPKNKNIKVNLEVNSKRVDIQDIPIEDIEAAKKTLADFEKAEKDKHDREEAMNSLEGLIYDLAVKLEEGEEYAEFVTEEEKKSILDELAVLRTWFEDDVTFETKKEEFIERKKKLDTLTEKPDNRKKERLDMPKVVEALDDTFNRSRTFYSMAFNLTQVEVESPTFTLTEIEVLSKLIDTTEDWWREKQEVYVKQAKNEDPIVTVMEIAEKIRDLEREVKYLVNKIKLSPKKKKADKKKKDENKQEKTNGTKTETEEEPKAEEGTTTEKVEEEKEHDPSEL